MPAADPWESKPITELSDKDREKLMNKSPWAKKVQVDTGRGPAAFSGPATSRGDAASKGGGGRSGPQGGGGEFEDGPAPGGGGGGGAPNVEALVRWESARAVLEAQKRTAPEAFQGQYAISVSGFPIGGPPQRPTAGGPGGAGKVGAFDPAAARAGQTAALEKGKETTRLERKGKDPIHPSVIAMSGRALVLLFPHGSQPIQADDKEVTLVLQIGMPALKTKFNLKDMIYDGKLEL
jgi:hypothetical protein